jgi:hypothetical protein
MSGPTNLYHKLHNENNLALNIESNLIYSILNNIPVSFLKFGDGEALAALTLKQRNLYILNSTTNCDYTMYTKKLRIGLLNAIKYFVDQTDNAYIGMYPLKFVKELWEKHTTNPIKWAEYGTLMMYHRNSLKYSLYLTIKQCPLYKLIICKESLIKAVNLFNINKMITVDPNNWFECDYDKILKRARYFLSQHSKYSQCIVITCAGMGAKVLISELHKTFPNNIYLDFGSALDLICTGNKIRDIKVSYSEALKAYIPPPGLDKLLPKDF